MVCSSYYNVFIKKKTSKLQKNEGTFVQNDISEWAYPISESYSTETCPMYSKYQNEQHIKSICFFTDLEGLKCSKLMKVS